MRRVFLRVVAVSVCTALALTLIGCSGAGSGDRAEDSNATLDALMGSDPSAMSDELMSSGGWQGRSTIGSKDYRVYQVQVDGRAARLYYEAAGGEGSQQGLALYMYDVEPFQLDQ